MRAIRGFVVRLSQWEARRNRRLTAPNGEQRTTPYPNKKDAQKRLIRRHSYGNGLDEYGAQAAGQLAYLRRMPIYLEFQALHLVFEAQLQLLQPHFL